MKSLTQYIYESLKELELVQQRYSKDEIFNRVVMIYLPSIINVIRWWENNENSHYSYNYVPFFKNNSEETLKKFLYELIDELEKSKKVKTANFNHDNIKNLNSSKLAQFINDEILVVKTYDLYNQWTQKPSKKTQFKNLYDIIEPLINKYKSQLNLCSDWFFQYYVKLVDYAHLWMGGEPVIWAIDIGLEYKGLSENDWIISFCREDVFESILKKGYIEGTSIKNMSYSQGSKKIKNGYNFGYKLKNINSIINENFIFDVFKEDDEYFYKDVQEYIYLKGKYGNHGFVFITDSLNMFHYTDKAEQNIFYGSDVASFIPFKINYNGQIELINNKKSIIKTIGNKIEPIGYINNVKGPKQFTWRLDNKDINYKHIKTQFSNNIKEFQQFILNANTDELKQYFVIINKEK